MTYTIVAFDGGGIRGLISALLLQQLQKDVQEQINQNFLANVSMFAGTSTGSFLALSMAQEPSACNVDKVVSLYQTDGPSIFTPFQSLTSELTTLLPAMLEDEQRPTGLAASLTGRLGMILSDPDKLIHVQYDNTNLQKALQNQLPDGATISELGPDILVTTLQLWNGTMARWTPFEITKCSVPTMTLVDAALCSSPAPTYFPPFLPGSYAALGYCVDGGTFANNPTLAAIAYAVSKGHVLSDIRLLSFGTGLVSEGITPGMIDGMLVKPIDWGIAEWMWPFSEPPKPAMPLLAAMMDSSSRLVDEQANQFLNVLVQNDPDKLNPDKQPLPFYKRLNPTLSQPIALDGISQVDMDAMQQAANNLIASSDWSGIVEWVATNFAARTTHDLVR